MCWCEGDVVREEDCTGCVCVLDVGFGRYVCEDLLLLLLLFIDCVGLEEVEVICLVNEVCGVLLTMFECDLDMVRMVCLYS